MSRYPLLTAGLSESRKQRFLLAVDTLMAAVQAGAIANPEYQAIKQIVHGVLEHGFRHQTSAGESLDYRTAPAILFDLIYYQPYLHNLQGATKRFAQVEGIHPRGDVALEVLREAEPLAVAYLSMKDKVIKRTPKPVEDRRAKYDAPMAGRTAIGQVKALLEEVTERARDELVAYFVDRSARAVRTYLEHQKTENEKGAAIDPYNAARATRTRAAIVDADDLDMLSSVLEPRSVRPAPLPDGTQQRPIQVYAPRLGIEELIRANAASIVSEIRDSFVYKNLAKLDSIVDAKADLVKGEVIGRQVDLGGLRGRLRFTFSDGAAFTVQNSVVWSRSPHGKAFQRFPLTFHNVTLSNGEQMGNPSEERMNTVFARGGSPDDEADADAPLGGPRR